MAYTRKPNQKRNTAKPRTDSALSRTQGRADSAANKRKEGTKKDTRNNANRDSRNDTRNRVKSGKASFGHKENLEDDGKQARPNNVKPSERKFGDRKRGAYNSNDKKYDDKKNPQQRNNHKDRKGGYISRYPDDDNAADPSHIGSNKSAPKSSKSPNATLGHKRSTKGHKNVTDQRMFGAPQSGENINNDKHGVASRKKNPIKPKSRRESFANFDTMPVKPRFKSKSDGTPLPREKGEFRIAKLLARAGVASRREIERMIADGRIALHGEVLETPATMLKSLSGVTVDGNAVGPLDPTRLFLYHKASGLLTAERDFTGRRTIYDDLPSDLPRLMPIGRLDLNTEGLLLMTNDGEFKREMELPKYGVERTYRARTFGDISQEQLESLVDGIEIEGIRYGRIDANLERRTGANQWVEMTLTEGKNREVRRVLEHFELQVSRLIRTRYGPYELGSLPVGQVVEVRRADVIKHRKELKS